jgi:hypothetical protein
MSKNQENDKKVLISPDDAKAAFQFFPEFGIPEMPGLKEAFDRFIASPTVENQDYLKYMLTKAISTTDHESFTDPSFKPIREECSRVAYEMGFDHDFEEVVGEEKE